MVERRQLFDFVHDLFHGLVSLSVRALALQHDLDGHGLSSFAVLAKFNFGEGTLSECAIDNVLVKLGCHKS